MRYYYLIFDETGSGFIITFDNRYSRNHDDQGPWTTYKWDIVWLKEHPVGGGEEWNI